MATSLPAAAVPVEAHRVEEPGPAQLLFRFAIGVTELAGEGLAAALVMFERIGTASQVSPEPSRPLAPRHAVIGALSAVPEWVGRKIDDGRRASGRALRAMGERRLLEYLPGARFARRRTELWRERARATVQRWALTGRREEQAGRALARRAVDSFFAEAVARIAESPDLKRVIEEQSEGLTVTAMSELRAKSARADGMVESITRRVLRRSK